jgi:hypothetical protein
MNLKLNPMDELEYDTRLQNIDFEANKAKNELYIEYAKGQEKWIIGDIIDGGTYVILIDKITAYKSFGRPVPVYHGPSLKKDLTPRKNGERGAIYGNEHVKFIKHVTTE